ncbi:MAG: DUF4097 family beta strand repeat protein [Phycisphaerales bacterium]|nr:MAG: DUF4097 family beta strand repeat protein [Phycisphaerales bacterium]
MKSRLITALVVLASLASSGCISGGACWGPTFWMKQTQELHFDTAGLEALIVRTHNGSVSFDNKLDSEDQATVVAKVKAGGCTHAQAEEAMQALKVYNERSPDGTQRLGWKWSGVRHPGWQGGVAFEIHAPSDLDFDGETHNGRITVNSVDGDVTVVTHNGALEITSRSGELNAATHNGGITADYAGQNIALLTHNGRIEADIVECGAVSGTIETHNGGVRVTVGDSTAAELRCETHNGKITATAPLMVRELSRGSMTGKLGDGGGRLSVSTHNGSIRINKAE